MRNFPLFLVFLSALWGACQEDKTVPPLRPLIYTEQQNDDPRLAEVREERFLRQLTGSKNEENQTQLQRPTDADSLGKQIVARLHARDKDSWEHLWFENFVFSEEFGLNLKDAAKKRDLLIAGSSQVWDQFHPGEPTQARKKGLASLLEFRKLILGDSEKGVQGTHYSNNLLVLEIKEAQLEIQFKIDGILEKNNRFGLVSTITGNATLNFLRNIGLHLRPQLQDPGDYIIPLKVGNYWRYRLSEKASDLVAHDIFEEGLSTQKGASTKTVEVTSIDRIEGRRLIRFLVSYDDEEKTKIIEHWLTTPTKIFDCDDLCVENFSDLKKLLSLLEHSQPLFSAKETMNVDVELPMGQFDSVIKFKSPKPKHSKDPRLAYSQTIYLKPRLGVVRRSVDRDDKAHELLIAYRLLP